MAYCESNGHVLDDFSCPVITVGSRAGELRRQSQTCGAVYGRARSPSIAVYVWSSDDQFPQSCRTRGVGWVSLPHHRQSSGTRLRAG